MSQVRLSVTHTVYSNFYLRILYTFYIIDDNNLYSLYLRTQYTFYIIDHNKNAPVKKQACGSQRRNGRDMTSRRRPTSRQLEVTATYRERQHCASQILLGCIC